MYNKKLIIFSLILSLLIINIGFVFADDNTTMPTQSNTDATPIINEKTFEDMQMQVDQSQNDTIELDGSYLRTSEDKEVDDEINFTVECPETIKNWEYFKINLTINPYVEEYNDLNVKIYNFDEGYAELYEIPIHGNFTQEQINFYNSGKYNIRFELKFDDMSHTPIIVDKQITVLTDYAIDLEENGQDFEYGNDANLNFIIPNSLEENVKVVINNKKEYYIHKDWEYGYGLSSYVTVDKKYLKYGVNNITIYYPGDENNKAGTFYKSINVKSSPKYSNIHKDDLKLIIECPDTVKHGEQIPINVTITGPNEDGLKADLYVYNLNEQLDHYEIYNNFTQISLLDSFAEGANNLKFELKFRDGTGNKLVVNEKITVKDYVIYISDKENDYAYGNDVELSFYIPDILRKDVKVVINNKKEFTLKYNKNYVEDEDWEENRYKNYHITIPKEDLKGGVNNITIIYPGDSKNKAHTFYETINVKGRFDYNIKYEYKSIENITLTLPSDANGKLIVYIDKINQTPVQINGGKAVFTLPVLDLGYHIISCNYTDDNKYQASCAYILCVTPKIHVPNIGLNGGNMTIEMPGKYNGNVSIYDRDDKSNIFSTGKIKNGKSIVPLKFDNTNYYDFYVKIDCVEYKYVVGKSLYVLDENPDWKIKIEYNHVLPYENQCLIIQDAPYALIPNYILTIDGIDVELYKDNKKEYEYDDEEEYEYDEEEENNDYMVRFDASNLKVGKHNFTLSFLGDGYYKPTNYSDFLYVEKMIVNIPETSEIYESETFDIILPIDAKGTLTVQAGKETVFNEKINPNKYDDNGNYLNISVKVKNVKYGITDVEVIYQDAQSTLTQTGEINGTYAMKVDEEIRYGGGILHVYAPSEINSKVIVSIDGTVKQLNKNKKGVFINDTADLSVGEHIAVIKYAGDSKYPKHTVEMKFNVTPIAIFPKETIKKGDGISLIMPNDAQGNLIVYIHNFWQGDDKIFYNQKAAGKTFIPFDNLTYGHYYVKLNYTGNDYNIKWLSDPDSRAQYIVVNPKITYPSKIYIGESESISIKINRENSIFRVTGSDSSFDEEIDIYNGSAKITLPTLKKGMHEFNVYLRLDYDFYSPIYEAYEYTIKIKYVPNLITAKDTSTVYSANSKYSVKVKNTAGKLIKSGKATFYILDGKKQILKKTTNIKNGVATLSYKITQGVKKYTIKTVYKKHSITKKITVKHVVSLKSVTVKKSAKKLVLQATLAKVNGKYLKEKTITFKFNGKTYKAKTDKKGVAKAIVKSGTLKKLKIDQKITYQATYLKDTIKKAVKVKK